MVAEAPESGAKRLKGTALRFGCWSRMQRQNETSVIRIGTAGWPVPASERSRFPEASSLLARYAGCFNAVEINSSFYRSHRVQTYRRWADTVPADFAFSAKLPREITHIRKLSDCAALLDGFMAETEGLGGKLKAVLMQLPPSLRFDASVVWPFLADLRARMKIRVFCEPRHPSWFTGEADALLREAGVHRAAADPQPAPGAGDPGGKQGAVYLRLHGAQRIYYSDYDENALQAIARRIVELTHAGAEVWCIFDNTAAFRATPNALRLMEILSGTQAR